MSGYNETSSLGYGNIFRGSQGVSSIKENTIIGLNTSMVIDFAPSAGEMLKLEVDTRAWGYNGGKTEFSPGDEPVYLGFKTNDVVITQHTIGIPEPCGWVKAGYDNDDSYNGGTEAFTMVETFLVANDLILNLKYPIPATKEGEVKIEWLGQPALVVGFKAFKTRVFFEDPIIGTCRITYPSEFCAFRIVNTPLELSVGIEDEIVTSYTIPIYMKAYHTSKDDQAEWAAKFSIQEDINWGS